MAEVLQWQFELQSKVCDCLQRSDKRAIRT